MLRLVVALLIAVPLLALGLLALGLEHTALVAATAALTPDHIERARWLLRRNDPRYLRSGVPRLIALSEADLDLAVNYLANQYAGGASRIVLGDGSARLDATIALAANPFGRYVNLELVVAETPALPRIERLSIGRVPVPAALCNWLVRLALQRLRTSASYWATADVVKRVRLRSGMLQVGYEWHDAVPDQIKAALVGAEEQARWQVYQARLVELAARTAADRATPLDRLLAPMLQLAAQRARAGDAAVENRAALIVLAFYVNGRGLAALVAAARDWPRAPARVVTLAGRPDFTQHFTISAALAASAGSPLADAVGLYKELEDARGGSGFSFNDLAADRAGTRLGALAVDGEAGARRLQQALARGLRDADLMPDVSDLPEFLSEAQFKRRYGDIGQPAYQQMALEIERRIAALALYR